MMAYSVILFHSNNNAIWTKKVLKKEGIFHKLIPVPRHLSSDCGYSVKIENTDVEKVNSILLSTGIEFNSIEPL